MAQMFWQEDNQCNVIQFVASSSFRVLFGVGAKRPESCAYDYVSNVTYESCE